MDYKSIETKAWNMLTEKRKKHTEGVLSEALSLAETYGCDKEKVRIAAVCHDIYRGVAPEELDIAVKEMGLPEYFLGNPNLAHGKIAAHVMETEFGIKDRDILNAVSYHTTGRAGMSLLEKIIFLADAIEPNRDYPGVGKLRNEAYEDLDKACLISLEGTIEHLNHESIWIHNDTLEAREWFLKNGKDVRMNSREMAIFAAKTLSQKKAESIVVIDVSEKSSFTDFLILATGGSDRQVSALADEVEDKFAKEGCIAKGIEGRNKTGWILLDMGDVIVNIFSRDMREKYSIEKVWGDCPMEEYND